MTREELLELMANADEQITRMRAVADEPDIVLVMSRDVCQAMVEQMDTEEFLHDFIPYRTVADNRGLTAVYHGYPVAIVNEVEATGMMMPAFRGMVFYVGMQLNDIIVVDDDNRLFRLESVDPIQYIDMDLTVRYGDEENDPPIVTPTYGAAMTDARVHFMIDDAIEQLSRTWRELAINADEVAAAVNRFSPSASYSTPVADMKELDAGDTKLMDEFLNGFAQKGFLQEAT